MRPSSSSPTVIDLRDHTDLRRAARVAPLTNATAATSDAVEIITARSLRNARMAALWTMVALNIVDLFVNRSFATARASDADVRAVVLFGGGAMPWMKGAVLVALGWAVLRSAPKLSSTCAMWCVVGVYALATWMNLAVLLVSR